ncbi:MAG: SAM-dependent methyltransferase [Azospira oryzae]|nr:MAG: SAM-dependent methyltransferase [Azospira oryzae]
MRSDLAKEHVQDYIFKHEAEDEKTLVLKSKEILGIPSSLIARQIAGRRKAKHKLPLWHRTKGIIYPPSINLEQSSSEVTAQYKSSLVPKGKAAADLTGGFGVDTFYLSKQYEQFYYIEPDTDLLSIVRHNFGLLGANNIVYVNSTAEEFIQQFPDQFDFVFIDPSRRSKQQKVFKLIDCIPNVIELMPALMSKSRSVMVKNSPLLDIQQGIKELGGVEQVDVVAVDNECKELLFTLNRHLNPSPGINAINLSAARVDQFSFQQQDEKTTLVHFSAPQEWLYEPNAAILKAGAFKTIVARFNISKLHPSTHLYTSAHLIPSFPGRTFKIVQHLKLDKSVSAVFPDGYANILTRNYPLSVEEIKKKTGLKEGGERYLIGTQSVEEKHVLLAERVMEN